MAFAAAIGPMISGIASLAGAAVSAAAMSAQAKQEEQIAAFNAQRQREKAALAQAKGAQESRRRLEEGERITSQYRAVAAQSGADTSEATPLLMQEEFAVNNWHNENLAVFDARTEQADRNNQANVTEWEGQIKANASRAQATASLISGFAGFAKSAAKGFG